MHSYQQHANLENKAMPLRASTQHLCISHQPCKACTCISGTVHLKERCTIENVNPEVPENTHSYRQHGALKISYNAKQIASCSLLQNLSEGGGDSDEAAQRYQDFLSIVKSKETKDVSTSEEVDMLLAMVKHAKDGPCTVEDLQDARKLRLGLLLLYQARIGQKNLVESTSIHINYDKLPVMKSSKNKLGNAMGLDSQLLVSGFSKLKDVRSPPGKPKQKITGKSLRDKKPGPSTQKHSSKKYVTEEDDNDEAVEPNASRLPVADMDDEPSDQPDAGNESRRHNVADSDLYKRVKADDTEKSTRQNFLVHAVLVDVHHKYQPITAKAVYGKAKSLTTDKVLEKLSGLSAEHREMLFKKDDGQ